MYVILLGKIFTFQKWKIQAWDAVLMSATYRLSGSFGSRVRSNFIGHNKYTDRRNNFSPKPTPIHGPVHKSGLNYSN